MAANIGHAEVFLGAIVLWVRHLVSLVSRTRLGLHLLIGLSSILVLIVVITVGVNFSPHSFMRWHLLISNPA